eukprot:XP_001701724.1 predicted protein [Chlamydomonas reinhardtii]
MPGLQGLQTLPLGRVPAVAVRGQRAVSPATSATHRGATSLPFVTDHSSFRHYGIKWLAHRCTLVVAPAHDVALSVCLMPTQKLRLVTHHTRESMASRKPGVVPSAGGRADARPEVACLGCHADLTTSKAYYRRFRICEAHMKSMSLSIEGRSCRFCQQWGSYRVENMYVRTAAVPRAAAETTYVLYMYALYPHGLRYGHPNSGKFHLVEEFDGANRNCRKALMIRFYKRRNMPLGGMQASLERNDPAAGMGDPVEGSSGVGVTPATAIGPPGYSQGGVRMAGIQVQSGNYDNNNNNDGDDDSDAAPPRQRRSKGASAARRASPGSSGAAGSGGLDLNGGQQLDGLNALGGGLPPLGDGLSGAGLGAGSFDVLGGGGPLEGLPGLPGRTHGGGLGWRSGALGSAGHQVGGLGLVDGGLGLGGAGGLLLDALGGAGRLLAQAGQPMRLVLQPQLDGSRRGGGSGNQSVGCSSSHSQHEQLQDDSSGLVGPLSRAAGATRGVGLVGQQQQQGATSRDAAAEALAALAASGQLDVQMLLAAVAASGGTASEQQAVLVALLAKLPGGAELLGSAGLQPRQEQDLEAGNPERPLPAGLQRLAGRDGLGGGRAGLLPLALAQDHEGVGNLGMGRLSNGTGGGGGRPLPALDVSGAVRPLGDDGLPATLVGIGRLAAPGAGDGAGPLAEDDVCAGGGGMGELSLADLLGQMSIPQQLELLMGLPQQQMTEVLKQLPHTQQGLRAAEIGGSGGGLGPRALKLDPEDVPGRVGLLESLAAGARLNLAPLGRAAGARGGALEGTEDEKAGLTRLQHQVSGKGFGAAHAAAQSLAAGTAYAAAGEASNMQTTPGRLQPPPDAAAANTAEVAAAGDAADVADAAHDAAYSCEEALERLSLKLHGVRPDELAPDVAQRMHKWLESMDAVTLQGTLRSGCVNLVFDVSYRQPPAATDAATRSTLTTSDAAGHRRAWAYRLAAAAIASSLGLELPAPFAAGGGRQRGDEATEGGQWCGLCLQAAALAAARGIRVQVQVGNAVVYPPHAKQTPLAEQQQPATAEVHELAPLAIVQGDHHAVAIMSGRGLNDPSARLHVRLNGRRLGALVQPQQEQQLPPTDADSKTGAVCSAAAGNYPMQGPSAQEQEQQRCGEECALVFLDAPGQAGLAVLEWEAGGGAGVLGDWWPLVVAPDAQVAAEVNALALNSDIASGRGTEWLRRLLVDVGLVIDAAHNSPAGGLHAGLEPGVLERLVCRARCVVPFCEARMMPHTAAVARAFLAAAAAETETEADAGIAAVSKLPSRASWSLSSSACGSDFDYSDSEQKQEDHMDSSAGDATSPGTGQCSRSGVCKCPDSPCAGCFCYNTDGVKLECCPPRPGIAETGSAHAR